MSAFTRQDRTWLCSVVFIDIVEYSKQSVDLQSKWKARFNRYLSTALAPVPDSERILLDTGDGAAICFLGDPEGAMYCVLGLRNDFVHKEPEIERPMRARMGINVGAVKLVRDVNGKMNAIGDGMNVAERVMGFAQPNQILVSRSFFEIVSSISDSYGELFAFEGTRQDKHIREHTVYRLQPPDPSARTRGSFAGHDPALLQRLEATLAAYLGPIARVCVSTASARTATAADLVEELAAHITAPASRAAFLQACAVTSAPPAATSEQADSNAEAIAWDEAVVTKARDDLAVHLGPIARVVVDRVLPQARSTSHLYELLAAEIPSARDREQFCKLQRTSGK